MQTAHSALAGSHERTNLCRTGRAQRGRQIRLARAARAQQRTFTLGPDPLETVPQFKYLGRWITQDDDDAMAVRAQLVKARKVWAGVGKILSREQVSPRTSGKFYMAIVQSVLLYGSESWCIGPALLARLEGFHIRCCYRMAKKNRPQKDSMGAWVYPRSAGVLNECGLYNIEHYIDKRRQMIVEFVATRALFTECWTGERMPGTPRRQWWWEQPMDLDAARAVAAARAGVAANDECSVGSAESEG